MTKYDPKDDPSSWQHDKRAHPGGPSAGVPGGPIPVSGPMTLEQHVWLHPKTGHADFAAQQAQSDRQARRETAAAQFLHSGGRSIDRGSAAYDDAMFASGGNGAAQAAANMKTALSIDAKRRDSAAYKAQLAPDER